MTRKGASDDPALVQQLLARAEVLHLAMRDEGGLHVVPVNFAQAGQTLYIHSGKAGRKAAALTAGAEVAFSAIAAMAPKVSDEACHFGYSFESVAGAGQAHRVTDDQERRIALAAINEKYGAGGLAVDEGAFARTVIFAVEISRATARVKD